MTERDALVLDLLTAHAGLPADQVGRVRNWWLNHRQRGEELAPFLARHGLLDPELLPAVTRLAGELTRLPAGVPAVPAEELEALGRQLALVPENVPEADAFLPPTESVAAASRDTTSDARTSVPP